MTLLQITVKSELKESESFGVLRSSGSIIVDIESPDAKPTSLAMSNELSSFSFSFLTWVAVGII